jgi:hypothetical protein
MEAGLLARCVRGDLGEEPVDIRRVDFLGDPIRRELDQQRVEA